MQCKTIIGYIGVDSDGWQYIHRKKPFRIRINKSEFLEDYPTIFEEGEWATIRNFMGMLKLTKILLGKNVFKLKWIDKPIKAKITIELED